MSKSASSEEVLSAKASAKIFPFLELPAELRIRIYEELFSSIHRGVNRVLPRSFPAILGVNRQIHKEALDELYTSSTFEVSINCNGITYCAGVEPWTTIYPEYEGHRPSFFSYARKIEIRIQASPEPVAPLRYKPYLTIPRQQRRNENELQLDLLENVRWFVSRFPTSHRLTSITISTRYIDWPYVGPIRSVYRASEVLKPFRNLQGVQHVRIDRVGEPTEVEPGNDSHKARLEVVEAMRGSQQHSLSLASEDEFPGFWKLYQLVRGSHDDTFRNKILRCFFNLRVAREKGDMVRFNEFSRYIIEQYSTELDRCERQEKVFRPKVNELIGIIAKNHRNGQAAAKTSKKRKRSDK